MPSSPRPSKSTSVRRCARGSTGSPPGPAPGTGRLREGFDLVETGLALMEQNLRRDHPGATEEEIREKALEWMSGPARSQEAPGFLVRSPGRLARLLRDQD